MANIALNIAPTSTLFFFFFNRVANIALNIDLAPTFLDMAGITPPEEMDGRSLLRLFDGTAPRDDNHTLRKKKAWRDSFLVERG